MKLLILLIFAAILVSLGSGLFYLSKDGEGSERMLKALKIRVALSIFLILFLVTAYWQGWIHP
jgi:uncharacterized membrane protein YdjX (TVP38/TMEM64 family)